MLPKQNRLSKDLEIKKAYRTRFCSQSKYFKIYLKKTENPNFQLLVVVSKKIFKKANKRNRVKRKIYAIFDRMLAGHHLPGNTSCIVQVIDQQAIQQRQDQLKTELTNILSSLYLKIQQTDI